MLRTLISCTVLSLATPGMAAVMHCTGSHPNWQAELTDTTARFQLRERTGDYTIEITTPAKNDPDTTAYTLISATDTAILIVHPGRCNTADHVAHILTQDRAEAVLLTGCCRIPPQ